MAGNVVQRGTLNSDVGSNMRMVRSRDQIADDVERLARQIAADYQGKHVVLVGALTGAYIFMADLRRALQDNGLDTTDCFMGVKTYNDKRESSRNPHITYDLEIDVTGLHVLLCDELFDKGHTLEKLLKWLRLRGAASVKSVVYAVKADANEVGFSPDYFGCLLPKSWLVGYGLDNLGKGRGWRDIYEVIFD